MNSEPQNSTFDSAFKPANKVIPEVRALTTSLIRKFDQEVSLIPGILKLTLGEPDFPTPDFIRQAAVEALSRNRTHYAPNAGTPGLRNAISTYLERRRGLHFAAENIIVTEGASEAISSVLTALLHPGAVLLYPVPGFGLYGTLALLNGAEPQELGTTETGFALQPEALERALRENQGRDVVLMLNSPSNPTGVTLDESAHAALAEVIKRYEVTVVSDEVYAEISYETRPAPSISSFLPDRTVLVDSTSKSFAMTGWRLGYFAAPPSLSPLLAKVHQTHVATAATFTMDAAQAAYERGDVEIDRMVEQYRARRDYLAGALTGLGYTVVPPSGAFFLYVQVPDTFAGTGYEYALLLAKEAKVAGIPGEAFAQGPSRFIRFSYAADLPTLREAVQRLRDFRKRYGDIAGQGEPAVNARGIGRPEPVLGDPAATAVHARGNGRPEPAVGAPAATAIYESANSTAPATILGSDS